MKALSVFLLFLIYSFIKNSNDCSSCYYFKNNSEITFMKYNAKGEKTGKEIALVEKIDAGKSGYKLMKYDKNDAFKEESFATVTCTNDALKIGFQIPNEVADNSGSAYYMYPSAMKVGQLLEGSISFAVKTKVNGKKTDISFSVKDRKVVDTEKVTIPYGTYNCYKIQYNLTVKFKVIGIAIPMNLKIIEWFSPGFGVVKTEAYNKDGNLEETSVLTSIRIKK